VKKIGKRAGGGEAERSGDDRPGQGKRERAGIFLNQKRGRRRRNCVQSRYFASEKSRCDMAVGRMWGSEVDEVGL